MYKKVIFCWLTCIAKIFVPYIVSNVVLSYWVIPYPSAIYQTSIGLIPLEQWLTFLALLSLVVLLNEKKIHPTVSYRKIVLGVVPVAISLAVATFEFTVEYPTLIQAVGSGNGNDTLVVAHVREEKNVSDQSAPLPTGFNHDSPGEYKVLTANNNLPYGRKLSVEDLRLRLVYISESDTTDYYFDSDIEFIVNKIVKHPIMRGEIITPDCFK